MFIRKFFSRKKENDDPLLADGDKAEEFKVTVFDNPEAQRDDYSDLLALEQKTNPGGRSSVEVINMLRDREVIKLDNCCHYTVSNCSTVICCVSSIGGLILVLIGCIGIFAENIAIPPEETPSPSSIDFLLLMGAGALMAICGCSMAGCMACIEKKTSQSILKILPSEPIQASHLFDEKDSARLNEIADTFHMDVPKSIRTSSDLSHVFLTIKNLKKELPLFHNNLSRVLNEVGLFNTLNTETRQNLQKLIVDYVASPILPNESRNKKLLARR
jgi:hypothetical protein